MIGHPIDTFTGEFGLKAVYGYDDRSETNDPRKGECPWRLIANRRGSEMEHLDGPYDPESFYDLEEMTGWIRRNHDATLLAAIRWDSHGPMGAFKIDEKVGERETLTKGVHSEAIAVIDREELAAACYRNEDEAFGALTAHLEVLSQWTNGWIYRFEIIDHRGQVIAGQRDIYGDQHAARRAQAALTAAESAAAREITLTDEWAARDVITENAVPGAIGSGR